MKTASFGISFVAALCLAVACGGDDDGDNTSTGGKAGAQGGKAGSSGGASSGGKQNGAGGSSGGTTAKGGNGGLGSGGKSAGGATQVGGAGSGGVGDGGVAGSIPVAGQGGDAGAGGVPVIPPPVMCEPPAPPSGAGGAGGADAGGAGGEANGGAFDGAGAGGASPGARGIAIQGHYVDNWQSHHVVTNAAWTTGSSVYHFSIVENGAHYAIARNDQHNSWNPCAWSRFDWARVNGHLYYCQTAYAAESESAALNTPAADASNLLNGCSGFGWTELTRE